MFRSIQSRVLQRVASLKTKTTEQMLLEKIMRGFLIQEFGQIGETLDFNISYENKKLRIRFQNKTAGNEVIIRSNNLRKMFKTHKISIDSLFIE